MVLSAFYPLRGGAENQARLQAAELVRRGHQVTVVTWRHDRNLRRQEVVDGIEIRRVRAPKYRVLGPLAAAGLMVGALARRVIVSDVVVAPNVNAPAQLSALIAWVSRKPVIAKMAASPFMSGVEVNQEDSPGLAGRVRRMGVRFLASHATAVAMTNEIEAGLRALRFRRIARIPNGVLDVGLPDKGRIRHALLPPLDVPETARLVVASGRLDPVKGFDRLLHAWALSCAEAQQAILLIVGWGPERDRLQQMVEEMGISDRVRFVSPLSDARDYLAAADVVVISSHYEGMSNVLLEAMASAVPVVSTPVSGSVDLIQDGYNGRIVPHDDPHALMAAVADVLSHPGSMGERARETVLARCRLEGVVDLYERLFTAVRNLPPGVTSVEQLKRLPVGR
ncbi:MAG TPA: glycosyltransferase family 4 protein [Chloroflexota bacterium]|nr:glycosyltransferase family 4 protein [Chloroflexota bacterium]